MKRRLRVGLIVQGGHGWLGGFEYIKNLALAVGSLPAEERSDVEITLISGTPLSESDKAQVSSAVREVICLEDHLSPPTLARRLDWKVRRTLLGAGDPQFSDLLRQKQIDFVYPYLWQGADNPRCRFAAWIPDFQHKYLPEFFPPAEVKTRDELFERTARTSPLVVVSSKCAQSDFETFFPFASGKSRVLSFRTSVDDRWYGENPLDIQREYNLPDKFFLVANQFWKHKNHLLVLQALQQLSARGVFPAVVFTGNMHDYRAPEHGDKVLQAVHRYGLHGQVALLGVVPRAHYVQLLRRSTAVIQPSLFEGWSTIVEDARALGKRILLSDLDVHHEQAPSGAHFFPRSSAEALGALIEQEWMLLTPGPDPDAERAARIENIKNVQSVGNHFLNIVREACAGDSALEAM